jgi:hypothetical protein
MKIESGQPLHLDRPKRDQGPKADDTTFVKSEAPSTVLNISAGAKQLQEQLNLLDNQDKVRGDLVAEAKAEMANWKGLSDDQMDNILQKMVDEMKP